MSFYLMQSGEEIDLQNMSIDNIKLDDIAHHLTKLCRYGGGLKLHHHYSVANHSIAMYYYAMDKGLSIDVQRGCLMHDASEAYLGDINGILKNYLPDYLALENMVTDLIECKYNLSSNSVIKNIIHSIDKRILLDEARVFWQKYYDKFQMQSPNLKPLGIKVYAEQDLCITKTMFLHCCERLNIFD